MAYASELEELAARAGRHEKNHELAAARADWQAALDLLPPDSYPPAWVRKLGPLAPVAVLLLKGKVFLSLLKLPFLLSFASFAALYWALYGMRFGIGLAVLILVHEAGHFIEVRRRGLTADLPMFIPGFGAYVRWTAAGVSPQARARVSLAGPLAGAVGAAFCAWVGLRTHERLWLALASFSAFINLMNLIPVWRLDGGQAIGAIDRVGRIAIALAAVLLAAGLSQPMLLLVAGGAVYRAFDKSLSPQMQPSYGLAAYFIILVAVLGYLCTLASPAAPPH